MVRYVVALCCFIVGFSVASAQTDQSGLFSATSVNTTTSNFYFAKPNELTIIVNIVGFVQKPGRYEISNSIDLMNLIALAGGPMPDGSLNDVKITRVVKAAESRYSKKEIVLNLEHLSSVNPAELVLQPGDFIHVDKTGWSTFRDVFGIAVSAAILTTAVVQVINLTKQ